MAESHFPPLRRAAAKVRCEAATPGPWVTSDSDRQREHWVVEGKPGYTDIPTGPGGMAWQIIGGQDAGEDPLKWGWAVFHGRDGGDTGLNKPNHEDLDFIAHARVDLPDALAEIERLEAEVAALRARLEDHHG